MTNIVQPHPQASTSSRQPRPDHLHISCANRVKELTRQCFLARGRDVDAPSATGDLQRLDQVIPHPTTTDELLHGFLHAMPVPGVAALGQRVRDHDAICLLPNSLSMQESTRRQDRSHLNQTYRMSAERKAA